MSKVHYCSSIWSNTSEENIKKVQLIQNYAARVIVGNVGKYDHVSPLLKELGWLRIKEHLQHRDAVLMHKCMYNQGPSYLSQMFTKRNQIHIVKQEIKMNLTYQSIGLRLVKEHLNTEELKFEMH